MTQSLRVTGFGLGTISRSRFAVEEPEIGLSPADRRGCVPEGDTVFRPGELGWQFVAISRRFFGFDEKIIR